MEPCVTGQAPIVTTDSAKALEEADRLDRLRPQAPERRNELAGRIRAQRTRTPRWERNALSPREAIDLRLAGRLVGQVLLDDAGLQGAPATGEQWVLVQKDREYVLMARSANQAIAAARSFIATRLLDPEGRPGGGSEGVLAAEA